MAEVRKFETGATRDQDQDKYDYEGFYSPLVVERFAEYMHKHRHQADGAVRDSDNWQKGIPREAYMKSLWRHLMDVWKMHRGLPGSDTFEDALCAILFNAQGYLFEILKERKSQVPLKPEPKLDDWACHCEDCTREAERIKRQTTGGWINSGQGYK